MTDPLIVPVLAVASYTKVVLTAAVVIAWGRWSTVVDKDAAFYHQERRIWNAAQMGAGILAIVALLFVPLFWIGLPLALVLIGGAATAYVVTRNQSVPEEARWRFDMETFRQALQARQSDKAARDATLRFIAPPGTDIKAVPLAEDSEYPAHLALEDAVVPGLERHGQHVDIIPSGNRYEIVINVDGTDHALSKLPRSSGHMMLEYLAAKCGIAEIDDPTPQRGTCRIDAGEHGNHTLQLRTTPGTEGARCRVVIDPAKQVSIPFNEMGLLEQQAATVKQLVLSGRGTVLVAGPPGQGRTTTMYAIVGEHDAYTQDLHSIEPIIERDIDGVRQHEVAPADTEAAVTKTLLQDPAAILVAAVSDAKTAQAIARAGAEGKRIYAGIPANDILGAIKTWLKAVNDPALVGQSLAGVVCQRLVRKLCTVCRQSFEPHPEDLKRMGLPPERVKKLYKSSGQVVVKDKPMTCPACHGSGFQGRAGAFEILVLEEAGKSLVAAGKLDDLKKYMRLQKVRSIAECALARVIDGTTTLNEVKKALGKG